MDPRFTTGQLRLLSSRELGHLPNHQDGTHLLRGFLQLPLRSGECLASSLATSE
jgi:hypothetical protein